MRIKISYITGDSENSYREEDYIDIGDKYIIENFKSIEGHYAMYRSLDGARTTNKFIEDLKSYMDNSWFVNSPRLVNKNTKCGVDEKYKEQYKDIVEYIPDPITAMGYLNLKLDSGEMFKQAAFWTGCFESLTEIEIVNNEFKVTF